jgi:hypothetical protein
MDALRHREGVPTVEDGQSSKLGRRMEYSVAYATNVKAYSVLYSSCRTRLMLLMQ